MFSFGSHREKPVLIFDIEGGSVASAIALTKGVGPARILVADRSYIPVTERTQDHHVSTTIRIARETLARTLKKYTESPLSHAHGAIQTPYVIVGMPWVRSRSTCVEEEYSIEKPVTDEMIKSLAKQALKQTSFLNEFNIFESSVTRVQVNGYPTGKPVGKHGHHLSVTVFQSEMVPYFRKAIETLVQELLPGRAIDLRSATGVALSTLHEKADSNHYLYIRVGSTDTDCIAAHKEDVNEHTTIPIGTSIVTQRLSGEHGLPDEVFSLLHMLMNDTCTTPACGALKTDLARLEPELVKLFGDAFAALASKRKIPNLCFLAAHPRMAPWLAHFFARIDFAQFTVTAQPLSISLLTPEYLRENVAWVGTNEDTGLGLAVAFVNTLAN